MGLFQELLGGGEVAGRFLGARMVVAEDASCSGEDVLAELPRCLDLAHCKEDGSEIVRDLHRDPVVATEYSPRSGKRVLAELPRRLDLTERIQIADEVISALHGPDMVLAHDPPRSGKVGLV